jgi:hypothetical protein
MTNKIITASDNVVAWFNKYSSYANREFVVMHDGLPGAGGTGMFKVEEDGTVTVTGAITRSGTVVLEDYTGCSTAVVFKTAGTTKASFNLSGRADFSQGGIRLPILTTDPNIPILWCRERKVISPSSPMEPISSSCCARGEPLGPSSFSTRRCRRITMSNTIVTSQDNVIAVLGSTSYTGKTFIARYGSGNTTVFEVAQDSGRVTIYGDIERANPHAISNIATTGTADIADFTSQGDSVGSVDHQGKGLFATTENAGVILPLSTTNPNGTTTGGYGDMMIWHHSVAGGFYYLCLCISNPGTTWRGIQLS